MEKVDYFDNEVNMLPIHKELSKLNLNKIQMDFDATSLYTSAMWDDNSIYPKVEIGYAFNPHMKDTFLNDFNKKAFNQDGNDGTILKTKYYKPPILVFQHLPVKEKVKNIEVNRMKNAYIIDRLTSVDFQGIVKKGGNVIRIYEGLFYRENFEISPSRKIIEKLFNLGQKYKNKKN